MARRNPLQKRPYTFAQTKTPLTFACGKAADHTFTPPQSAAPAALCGLFLLRRSYTLQVVADAGYSNGEQIAQCEEVGITPFVPVMRTVNNQGDGTLYGRTDFRYDPETDSYLCPGEKRLTRKHTNLKDRYTMYKASSLDCGACSLKSRCTHAPRRGLARHLFEDALNRMEERITPQAMRLRRQTVEHPFATIKYRIFGHPRLLVRGLTGARIEIAIATMAYNLKQRISKVLGMARLTEQLQNG